VQQDEDGAQDSEKHVNAKPVSDVQPTPHASHAFSQWIEKQEQHEGAADDAECIAEAGFRCQVALVAYAPAEVENCGHKNPEEPAPEIRGSSAKRV
jgi:hypothetical protein